MTAGAPDAAGQLRRDSAVLMLLCLLLFGWNAASAPLFDLDEGAFSQATLEMLQNGDWLRTWLNGLPRYDKPILTYWLQAGSVQLLGVRELAFRLPSIMAASLWVLAVFVFLRQHTGRRDAAWFGAGTLALSLMVGVIAHAAIADALLNLFLALSFLDLWRYAERPRLSLLLRTYLWIALGMLTKGPIALALPVVVSLAWYGLQGRWRDWFKAALHPLGWLLLLAVLGVWIVPLLLRGEGDFLVQFFMQHNVGRLAEAAEGHGGGPWYYLVWLPVVVLPFTALLPSALATAKRWRQDPLGSYLLLWFTAVFLLFSLSATQLPHYILYGCTPLFILFGRNVDRLPRPVLALLPALLICSLLATLPAWLPLALPPERRAFERGIVELAMSQLGPGYWCIGLGCVAGVLVLMFRLPYPTWQRLLVAGLLQAILVWGAVVPILATAQQGPVREAGRKARELGLPAVSYRSYLPSFSVYRGAVTPNRSPEPGELVFLRRDRLKALAEEFPAEHFETLYESGGIALLRRPPATERP